MRNIMTTSWFHNLFISLLVILFFENATAALYCNRPYSELKQNSGYPYDGIGFLNNGCTASLIDQNHILAAAHCFVDPRNGQWQTGLRFYPNFHPDRVQHDQYHVPRGDVTRSVVGTRAGGSVLGYAADWGIARVDNWKDIESLKLTPLYLAETVPIKGEVLLNPAYTRSHFPYNDNDSEEWDNMEWDTKYCNFPEDNILGIWSMRMRTAPIYDGNNSDSTWCNARWTPGIIHANCSLKDVKNDVIVHDCDTSGGSSGSPIMSKDSNGLWNIIGVGHGFSHDFSVKTPVCIDEKSGQFNVGPSVERFRNTPRFASNIAVHRRPDNPSATAIFAVDSDWNRVVYRTRKGNSPTYKSQFNFWTSLGTPQRGTKLSKIAACSAGLDGKPQTFVIAENKKIFSRLTLSNNSWGTWTEFNIPSSANGVVDIDAATDANGHCMLFMVDNDGRVYSRSKISDHSWDNWYTVASGSYRSITSLNYNDVVWVAMINSSGNIWRTFLSQQAEWTTPTKLSRPAGITWRDIDMTWDEYGRGFLLAIPASVTNKLHFMPMYGQKAWDQWRFFDTQLWTPESGAQNAPNIQSITASRWMEDSPGKTSPVIFATDDYGNIYFIEYSRVAPGPIINWGPRWILEWKSFYHEYIPY